MIRKIIKIDEEKCDGCGACANACHEGAIGIVDGKAKLLRDDYCDGLGNCLPVCHTGAITFEEREALPFNEDAVAKAQAQKASVPCACPGSASKTITPREEPKAVSSPTAFVASQLRQWPVQIKLVPVNAPYFDGAHLLIAADCAAYAYGNFHHDFMKRSVTLIGCPKLDMVDYTEKLTAILSNHSIESVTCVRMEVPCCKGIADAVKQALMNSQKFIPWRIVTISTDGNILE